MKFLTLLFLLVLGISSTDLSAFSNCVNEQLGMDSSGNAFSVWQTEDQVSQNNIIQGSMYSSSVWSAVVALSSTDYSSYNPILAVSENGHAVAVWLAYDSNGKVFLQASTLPAGGTWGSVQTISSDSDNPSVQFQVSINTNGQIVVTWNCALNNFSKSVIRANNGTVNGIWVGPQTISY